MKVQVLIIGSGLAGAIAYNTLKPFKPLVVDRKEKSRDGKMGLHPAVMRLRDHKVADLLKADFEEVKVSKGIFLNGSLLASPSIKANNLYSRKVYGAIGRRSLNDIGDVTRYILPNGYPEPEQFIGGMNLTSIPEKGVACFSNTFGESVVIEYDWVISTLPMPALLFSCLPSFESDNIYPLFKSIPIYTMRMKLSIPSSINQTIYYPEPSTSIYRITIQHQDIIVESIDENIQCCELIESSFGIPPSEYSSLESTKVVQLPIGKIFPIEEDSRLNYIMDLTDQYHILSFGRFAVWRPLRTDQLLSDIEKIRRLISATEAKARYRSRF